MAKVYIRAGHGGADPGATNGKRREADDNLRLALEVEKKLKTAGHTVKLSRRDALKGKPTPSILAICKDANAWGADVFMDFHRNSASASATGTEVLVRSNSSKKSRELAEELVTALCKVGGVSRGVKTQDVNTGSLASTTMPGVIVELLFISNPNDNKMFDSRFDEYAAAIVDTVCDLFGGSKPKNPEKPKSKGILAGQKYSRIMRNGMTGDDILQLKKAFYKAGYKKIETTHGRFGSEIYKAIIKEQTRHKLTVDGIVGKNTVVALGGVWKG